MTMTSSATAFTASSASSMPGLKAALAGGLAAGVLDFVAACVAAKATPMIVGQAIATGVLGRAAFQGGAPAALLGAGFHFAILLVIAAVYVAASRRMEYLYRQPILCGLVLGLIVYSVMQALVLPFSNAALGSPTTGARLTQIGIHMLFVGLPITLAAARIR